MSENNIRIRALRSLDEMREAVDLQRLYWGEDVESLVPAHMLFTIASYGGHVLAAFDGSRMVGVLIGLIGSDTEEISDRPAMANLLIASKRMVVLPEYRGGGIGYRLKLAQRDAAIKQGVRLVTWTFDPLRAPNAYLNLRKLGGVVSKYQKNLYGTNDASGLAVFGHSDRLRVDWWVTSRRVEERLNGSRPDMRLSHYLDAGAPILNPTTQQGMFAYPPETLVSGRGSFGLVEIPLNFGDMILDSPDVAQMWQAHTRDVMMQMFASGFVISDFLRDTHEGRDRGFYVFSFNMSFDPSQN